VTTEASLSKSAVEKDEPHTKPADLNGITQAYSDSHGLTLREQEVLALLAKGRSSAIIARQLTISRGTAQVHIKHIYNKTGMHTQQELIDAIESLADSEDQKSGD
jgi:DNA-binding CsgD family transcriptional regulator